MPRRVRLAILIAFLGHGLFILTTRYRLSYDAYTHMLFANHYAENWFSLWEARWYAGFTVVSYPPLTHQLTALLVPFLGFDKAFAFILWLVTSLYPLGIYAFSRNFTGRASAAYAALASALLVPIYVAAHIFGQLPFLTSTLTALFAATSFHRYLREGGLHNFILSVAVITTSMAMHHATSMVQPFLLLAVTIHYLFFEKQHSYGFWRLLFGKLIVFGLVSTTAGLLVIFPFWQWGTLQTLQTPIDHLSRHNFFLNRFAPLIFFFPLYGPFVVMLPFLIRKWQPHLWGLLASFAILFLLGLGGTTPLPRIFFGEVWEWLTYDRFAFWACLLLTPLFGRFWIQLRRRSKNLFLAKPVPVAVRRGFLSVVLWSFFAMTVLVAWLAPIVFPTQPRPIAMQPIVDFLNQAENSQWRYLTFGFGDQFAYLNLLTKATTIDGSYHTARTLPELRSSGVGQVDTSYWMPNGIAAIRPIVRNAGEHSVRWGFLNPEVVEAVRVRWGTIHRSPFISVLDELGWKQVAILENGVLVYENPKVTPLKPEQALDSSSINSFVWGVLPMLVFVMTLFLGTLRVYPVQTEWVLRKIHALSISLIPLALCFWVYRTIEEFTHPRVYFTYDHALFFLSDALVLFAILAWLAGKVANFAASERSLIRSLPSFYFLLFALLLLSTGSIFWSRDWRTSLYIAAHLWLLFLLILSLRDWHSSWGVAMYGLCAALTVQLIVGFAGFALQSTSFLSSLNLTWPGVLEPSMRGASVVQLATGLRVLRSYGTLPHPNILGGIVLITLLGPVSLFLASKKPNYPALILVSLGLILLLLTFSRAAWLGWIAFATVLIIKFKNLERRKLGLLIATIALSIGLGLYALRDLVFTRLGNQTVATEQISTVGRSWLTQQALETIRVHPLLGVGIGSFIIELAETALEGAPIEPVHNWLLLVTAELGVFGLALAIGLVVAIALTIIRSKSPPALLASAVVAGLGFISLFDHYLWTLAPGRVMLGLALGLWAGQVANEP